MVDPELVLIIGGARSGKSTFAEQLAAASGRPVLYVATLQPGDAEMTARITAHRERRPAGWRTVEVPLALVETLAQEAQPDTVVLLDCLTLWVSNLLLARCTDTALTTPQEAQEAEKAVLAAVDGLLTWYATSGTSLIVVTNEVGAGVVPPYPLGRLYRDILGLANQRLARAADRVYSVTAGLALELKGLGARPVEEGPAGRRPDGSLPQITAC